MLKNAGIVPIKLKIDDEEAFDYEKPENSKYNIENLRNMINDEINMI